MRCEYWRAGPGEAVDRAIVTVSFLRLDSKPRMVWPELPENVSVELVRGIDAATYRDLYERVGGRWLWWLRRMMPDSMLETLLADRALAVYSLRFDGRIGGFFELDSTPWPDVNLSYFGLLEEVIGRGLGFGLLGIAINEAFSRPVRGMTVNTCTADHPRALPNYQRAGFRIVRQVREVWDIPTRFGLVIPKHLRADYMA